MKHITNFKASCRDFLRGRFTRPESRWMLQLEIFWQQIGIFFEELLRRRQQRDGGNWGFPPFTGKLAPIRPTSPSHLVAAKAMPPSEVTHLMRKR
jgi:hypothetical protein